MSFNFDGSVLRGATSGGTNSKSTALATSGVLRDVKPHPTSTLVSHNPNAIDLSADQYRASVLNSPNQSTVEYIIWASNTGKISTIVGDINEGADPYLTFGNVELSFSSDGRTILIFNEDSNSIDSVFGVVLHNSETDFNYLLTTSATPIFDHEMYNSPTWTISDAFESTDLESGILRVKQEHLDLYFEGGFDSEKHTLITASYFLSPIKFYWSRNDLYQKRFFFDYRVQSWRLIKGSTTLNLGVVNLDTAYPLTPTPENLIVGTYLKGDSANTDNYSMLRVGRLPNSGALPLAENPLGDFNGVLVVTDAEVTPEYDFSAHNPPPYAVVGEGSAVMIFNPAFVLQKAGQNVWYSYQDFVEGSNGFVGLLEVADFTPLFISPIPKAFERPFIKVGNRRYLSPIMVKNDSELGSLSISNDREVGISLSTGQLKFHSDLIGKAQKDSVHFDYNYLGAKVYYDGVGLNIKPQPLRSPTPIVSSGNVPTSITQGNNGKVYIDLADPFANNGLGQSGILHQPDGTGVPFNLNVTTDGNAKIGVRPGGDSDTEDASGLTREIVPRTLGMPKLLSLGDTFIFTSDACITIKEVDKVETENLTQMTKHAFTMRGNVAEVTREGITSLANGFGSAVKVSSQSRSNLGSDEVVYFMQSLFTPSFYINKAQITSRIKDNFSFVLTEDTLIFSVDTVPYKWSPSQVSYTTDELITDILTNAEEISSGANNLSSTTLTITNNFGYLVFECDQEIEIGFGLNGVKDLSGCAKIGLNPGWRAKAGQDNWLADSGISFGLERSPLNRGGGSDIPDFYALYRLKDQRVSPKDGLTETPVLFLDYSPLEDIAGYDENVFFRSMNIKKVNGQEIPVYNYLKNYEEVVYNFGERYLLFIEDMVMDQPQKVESTTSTLLLGATQMVPETFLGVQPNPTYGLFVAEGSPLERREMGTEFLLDKDAGLGVLISKYGELMLFDFLGQWSDNSDLFSNAFALGSDNFDTLSVSEGDKLKILSGDSAGYYIVQERIDANTVRVSPQFKTANGSHPVAWELYKGFSRDVYDPSLVADISYKPFSHIVNEPLKVRLLSWVGNISTSSQYVLDLGDSLINEHEISLRFTTDGSVSSLYRLVIEKLGIIANNHLFISLTPRVLSGNFCLSMDTTEFVPVPLNNTVWMAYAFDPDTVYFNTDTGEIKFGDNVLTNFSSADVYYKETFLASADLPSGSAEFNPFTGECVISEVDRSANVGNALYFVQQVNTSGQRDIICNPLGGSVFFLNPLKDRRIVEIEYFVADDLGEKLLDEETNQPIEIKEFLPLYIRSEQAVFIESNKFSFNLADADGFRRNLFSQIEPRVVVNGFQCNYGVAVENCVIEDNTIYLMLDTDIGEEDTVSISYAVLESLGGEQVYNTSQRPMYRPSFFIEEEKDTFTLETDRTADFEVGMLFRLGADNFYIKSASYDSVEDQTTVTIFPPTIKEVGSRSPNNDILSLLSSEPIAHAVDPDDLQSTNSRTGFLIPLTDPLFGTSTIEWKSVNRGQSKIEFLGDITKFAVTGHILEIGGTPFTISQSNLSNDGLKTIVELISVFPQGYSPASDEIKISVRPIYPPFTQTFIGLGGVVETQPHSVILFGEKDDEGNEKAGRELVKGVHYGVDPSDGTIVFIDPLQAPLLPTQILYFNHTRINELKPYFHPTSQTMVFPRYWVKSKVTATPNEENELLGAFLQTRNTFHSPDTFYSRVTPLLSFSGETVQRLSGFTAGSPQGPISTVSDDPQSSDKGVSSLETQRSNIIDDDRSAKLYLEFYNVAVNAFEQVSETITGTVIGDRDGKFRFFIGRGKEDAPKGYECPITGVLNPINIWALIFESESGFALVEGDDLLDPRTATLVSAEIDGDNLDSETFETLSNRQQRKIKNDIDDIVLTRRGRWKFKWFELTRKGVFSSLAIPSVYSRLFPEQAKTFLLTYPGLMADLTKRTTATNREDWSGHYAYSKVLEKAKFSWQDGFQAAVRGSTRNKEIGVISNPAIGQIRNIQDVYLSRRYPRARIFEYYPDGINANAFGTGFPSSDISEPCVLATPLELSKFPIDPLTGMPNLAVLRANGGEQNDLSTGDPDLRTPPFTDFELTRQVAFGFPNGDTLTPVFSEDSSGGIFVKDVQYGCLITFEGGKDSTSFDPIITSDQIVTVDSDGDPADEVSLKRGDTIYLISPINSIDFDSLNNPLEADDIRELAKLTNSYDAFVDRGRGVVLDKSFWSHKENEDGWYTGPWPFTGNPPPPMAELEGEVTFNYDKMSFFEFPALRGEGKDDNGDHSIPYLKTNATERDRFSEITRITSNLLSLISPSGYYVYADEIRDDDGEILNSLTGTKPPSALITTKRHNPHSFLNTAIGKNDTEQFDLLLMEYLSNANLPNPSQGILSVGRVYRDQLETLDGAGGGVVSEFSVIEPPRFISPSAKGIAHRYFLKNAMVHIHDNTEWDWSSGPPPNGGYSNVNTSGVVIHENTVAQKLVFDFSSLGQIELGDGTGTVADPTDPLTWGARGGFNSLFKGIPQTQNNTVYIDIFARELTNSPAIAFPIFAGDKILTIAISNNGTQIDITYGDGSTLSSIAVETIFGIWSPDYQQSGSNNDFKTIIISGMANPLDLATHTEVPNTYDGTTTTYVSDYAFDFSISVLTDQINTVDNGSYTARILSDRLTFSESYDLRYARPRGVRHPVGKQLLEASLRVSSVDVEDNTGTLQLLEVTTDPVNTFTFLERDTEHLFPTPNSLDTHYGIGTFTTATQFDQGDEQSTIRLMAFEGQTTFVNLALNPPTLVVTVEDIDDDGDSIPDRLGVITSIEVTDPGGAVGLEGEIIVTISGTGTGAIATATLDENGDLPLGELNILNGGRGYGATPTIVMTHNNLNVPVVAQDITFALVPSSVEEEHGDIGEGTALLESTNLCQDTILSNPQFSSGGVTKIEKGDILVIPSSSNTTTYTYGDGTTEDFPNATGVCGTYLVRQALKNNFFGFGHFSVDLSGTGHAISKTASFPNTSAWVSAPFPKVDSIDKTTNTVILKTSVRYDDSPSNSYFGKKFIISHLVITSAGTGFTAEDIGERFSIGGTTDCIVEIVGVDQTTGEVTELSIIDRGTGFFLSSAYTGTIAPLGGGVNCDVDAFSVQEQYIFFVLEGTTTSIAISCPFVSIYHHPDGFSEFIINLGTMGTPSSKVFFGQVQLDNSPVFSLAMPDGSVSNLFQADLLDFIWDQIANCSYISGHKYLPINLRKNNNSDRYVGKRYLIDPVTSIKHHISSYGFLSVTLSNSDASVSKDFASYYVKGAGLKTDLISERFGENEIGVFSKEKTLSNSFLSDEDAIIFDDVPTMLDLQSISDAPADTSLPFYSLHNDAQCLLRGDKLITESLDYSASDLDYDNGSGNTITNDMNEKGFIAKEGIYTEPSFPRPAQNYISGNQRVVEDTSPTVDVNEIGYRRSTFSENVKFLVKRIRRFHQIQTDLQGSIHPLRYAYEIRRGVPTDYSKDNKGVGVMTANNFTFEEDNPAFENLSQTYVGTQLGEFNEEDVNIESGDMVRLLFNGEVVETAEILRVGEKLGTEIVDKGFKLSLKAPGFTNSDWENAYLLGNFTNWSFEIFLRNAIIPHEQSNEELLSLITERVLLNTKADMTNQLGGYVPHIPLLSQTLDGLGEIDPDTGSPKTWESYANKLYDDLNAPNPNDFFAKGIAEGDIVIIDSAGRLEGATGVLDPVEKGTRPFGDFGIEEREDGGANSVIGRNAYEIGSTSPLDDNRGFYKVLEVKEDHLVLQSGYSNKFVGKYNLDVTFPEDQNLKSTLGYTLYPTIHNSNLHKADFFASSDGKEGQMDLRPTQYAGYKNDGTLHPDTDKHNSFAVSDFSIRPFSYRIIRPSSLFTEETIELVLMIRERMSSLIEHLKSFMILEKSGTYYEFQDNQHIEDIGTPTIAETGLGVYHNAYLEDILGRMDLSPFGNDSDCLSLLDRRFIIQDSELDTVCPDSTGVGSGLVSSLGGVPYTAYEDTSGFYGGSDGSLVRPLLLDHIEIVLNDRDQFRDLRSTWIEYRTHRTQGLLSQLREFDRQIAKKIADQRNYYLRLKAQK